MPISNIVGEMIAQAAMELGGNTIYRLFGWVGCVAVTAFLIGAVAVVFWLLQ